MTATTEAGILEVRLGEIAMTKESRQHVKDFGNDIADHGKAGEDSKAAAAKYSGTLPTALAAEQQAIVGRLDKLWGGVSDKACIDEMVTARRMRTLLRGNRECD